MAHNLDLGPDGGVAHTLALLRAAAIERPIGPADAPTVPLVPGAFLALDPEGEVHGTLASAPGRLLALDLRVERPGRWLALHLSLGETDLTRPMVLGFACRSRAPAATPVRPALRSGTAGGFADRFFRKTLVAHAETSVHLDALVLAEAADVPRAPTWRDLILFFRPESLRIDIEDLRLFAV